MNRTTIDLWVGIFVALGLGAIVFLSMKVGNLANFKSDEGYHIEARFDNIGGLKQRAPVRSAGVVVGRVERIRLDPKTYEAIATLRIEPSYQFTKDTIASILTSGLLGEVYVGLDPGGDTAMLKDGDRINKTQSAVVLEKMISQFMFGKAAEAGGSSSPAPSSPAPSSPAPVTPSPAPAPTTGANVPASPVAPVVNAGGTTK